MSIGKCSVDGCVREGRLKKGMCEPHYKQMWRHGKIVRSTCRGDRPMGICSVDGCGRAEIHSRLCNSHYARKYREVEVNVKLRMPNQGLQGPEHPNWKGGEKKDRGRVMLWMPYHPSSTPKGYVYRYRFIMEQHLGRMLTSSEVVHHINGDESDDRIENLQLTTQSEHINLHRKDLLEARKAKHGC